MGSDWLLKAVIAAVIGGLGSFSGAVLGGLALGLARRCYRSYLPDVIRGLDRFARVVFIIVAMLFIVRPQGLFKVDPAPSASRRATRSWFGSGVRPLRRPCCSSAVRPLGALYTVDRRLDAASCWSTTCSST